MPATVRVTKAGRSRAWRVFSVDSLGPLTKLALPFSDAVVSFEVVTRLYRDVRTGFVAVTAPRERPLQVPLPRDLERWAPAFTRYASLPRECGPLRVPWRSFF